MTYNQYPPLNEQPEVAELGLKDKNEEQLMEQILIAGEDWHPEQRHMVVGAYNLARHIHQDDKHKDLPYTYHLLRNANRAVGYLHITDPEIIAAIILHDSVEDRPDEILATAASLSADPTKVLPIPKDPTEKQQAALEAIGTLFTPRVATVVAAVTNPPASETKDLSYDEKMDKYAGKVRSAVQTTDGWIVKFVDWADNGLGIIHGNQGDSPKKSKHFSRKYGLVLPIFEERFKQDDIQQLLDPSARAYVEHHLQLGRERLTMSDTIV